MKYPESDIAIQPQAAGFEIDPENKGGDEAGKSLAASLELLRRASELDSLEELQYFLVNDLRVLVEFDRSFLLTHMERKSQVTAAANQPTLDTRSKIYESLLHLASHLRGFKKGLLLRRGLYSDHKVFNELDPERQEAITEYMEKADCSFLFVIPLVCRDTTVAHLVMEFFDAPPPSQAQAMALLGVSSVFSTFFLEKWIMNKYPRVASGVLGKAGELNTKGLIRRNLKWFIPVLAVIAAWALLWPMDVEVGGEAQVTTLKKNVAFCRMEGLIERTLVTEGELVEENQTLAILDPTELTYKIESARREYELLSKKLNTLSVESDTDLKKLAEAQLVKLRRKKIRNDLEFYEWQRQFLDIKAPTSGIVLTKDVQSITGKKLKAGEPFCELGKPSELAIDVFVPDNRAPKVEIGQELKVYLNNAPLDAHNLIVDKIAPATEVIPRLGNVCRVRAGFESPPQSAKIGMKGVGKISVGRSTPWELFRNSMAEKLNKLSLYF